jgi:GMP synthase (glutamine-hydrolysing)
MTETASPPLRKAIAIRHVGFETLGTFEHELERAGYALTYADIAAGDLVRIDAAEPDLLIVLGGPVGVYETDAYPFLATELALIEARLRSGLPILGICLGAQLIAAALDARVAPTGTKEIGFAPIALTEAGQQGPLRHLAEIPVLHWHGDAFELPLGAALLATTSIANQAFAIGPNVLGLQFHPEADTAHHLEAWLIGHACELAAAGIDPRGIRADAARHGPALMQAGRAMFSEWLTGLTVAAHPAGTR